MPVKKFVAIVTFFFVASACTASKLDADASVRVTGTVLDASGQPARSADVALFKRADIGEVLVGATLAIGTLGATCFLPNGPAFCRDARKAKTDDDGKFAFALKGSDTQGTVGNANDFDLVTSVRRPGRGDLVASVRFKIQREDLEVEPLRVWDADASVTNESGAIRASWPTLPADYGASPSYDLRFVDTTDKRVVWNVAKATPGGRVDARLVEDRRGSVEVGASTSKPGPDTTFRFTYFAQGAPFTGAGAPPSRRASCFASKADGQTTPINPCHLSDGNLYAASNLSGDGVARIAAYLDLGASKPVSLVTARGAPGTTAIETSSDATTWAMLGPGAGGLVSVALPRPVQARYVRIRTTNAVDISGLAELSVWF
jgi:hypothetical protein